MTLTAFVNSSPKLEAVEARKVGDHHARVGDVETPSLKVGVLPSGPHASARRGPAGEDEAPRPPEAVVGRRCEEAASLVGRPGRGGPIDARCPGPPVAGQDVPGDGRQGWPLASSPRSCGLTSCSR
jgi:hypothetical protein